MNKKFMVTMFLVCSYTLPASQAPWFSSTATLDAIKASLSKKEFPVDSRNEFGLTGLMMAADKGNKALAKALLDAGAAINLKSKDIFGNSALHLVVSDMNDANNELRIPLLELLLEHGADIHATNYKGQTPLHCLITVDGVQNMIKPLNMLISYGTPCNARDGRGATFLHNLVELRSSEMLAIVRRHYSFLFDEMIKNKENLTALGFAESIRCDECVIRFTDPAAAYHPVSLVNSYDVNGLTYLMVAAMTNNFKRAEQYSADKGDIDMVSNNAMGYTALDYALVFKNIQMVQWLLARQARTDIQNAAGYTPAQLFIATGACDSSQSVDNISILLKVIDRDPKVLNMQDHNGDTIMHILSLRNNSRLITTLAEKYLDLIDLTIRNNDLKTPLEIAEQLAYVPTIEILKKMLRTQRKKE